MKIKIHEIKVENTLQALGTGYPTSISAVFSAKYTADDTYREITSGVLFMDLKERSIRDSILLAIRHYEEGLNRIDIISPVTRAMQGNEYEV